LSPSGETTGIWVVFKTHEQVSINELSLLIRGHHYHCAPCSASSSCARWHQSADYRCAFPSFLIAAFFPSQNTDQFRYLLYIGLDCACVERHAFRYVHYRPCTRVRTGAIRKTSALPSSPGSSINPANDVFLFMTFNLQEPPAVQRSQFPSPLVIPSCQQLAPTATRFCEDSTFGEDFTLSSNPPNPRTNFRVGDWM